jgi:hypothetical protein
VKTLDSEIGAYEVNSVATLVIHTDDDRHAYADMNREQLDELIAKLQRVRQGMD